MSLKKIIVYLYLALFFFTPLIFSWQNSELFELPKMHFVYALTCLILFFHLLSALKKHTPLFPSNYLTLPLFLFLLSQTISTITSVDPLTSLYGYPSRLNGGLFSLLSYSTLSLILAIHITPRLRRQIISISLLSGFLVSVYAIGEHFGIDKDLWVQDVQARVFSTLGQPNWLSAYLAILLPFSCHRRSAKYYLLSLILFLTLLFTKSKSGLMAVFISLGFYFSFIFVKQRLKTPKSVFFLPLIFLALSLLIRNPIKDFLFPSPPPTANNQTPEIEVVNVTASEDIRKIVWTGAIDLWRQFPYFGTGVETFAYSYYWTRPVTHNLTSEWEFLYNKAHNEYLNFLATTGAFGLLTYLFLLFSIFKKLLASYQNFPKNRRLVLATSASLISILITNFAGFSVVIVNLYLFLLPALSGRHSDATSEDTSSIPGTLKIALRFFYVLPIFLFVQNFRFYLSDLSYATAKKSTDLSEQIEFYHRSLFLRPRFPPYLSALSTSQVNLALKNPADSANLITSAINNSNLAVSTSPASTDLLKQQAQNYYLLSTLDSNYFIKAVESLQKAIALAPTDAKNYYLLGRFLETASLTNQAIDFYLQATELKSNYDHAHFALGQIYLAQKDYVNAKNHLQIALDINPKNIEAKKLLDQIDQTN